ncbi:phospholipase D-like domain-containing protein [Streptomyces virginiae]|uniref:phospholipase D-like domain-containing protein n=1 Tax=Streptomyces virginiae TaxID=1961 RepID=UPI0033A56805
MALSLLAPSAARAETVPSGPYASVFNYPTVNGTYDFSISSDLNRLIDLADSGTLYMSMFLLNNSTGIQDRLLAAQARGVTLKIAVEQAASGSLDAFAANLTGGSSLTLCRNSCLGNGAGDEAAISHNKYVVFDSLSNGAKNVVWQSSQNMAGGQDGEINNAVTVTGNATLATRYRAAFNRQVQHAADSLHTTYDHTYDDPTAPVEAIFFPRDTASDAAHYGNADILASFIDQVVCTPGSAGRIRIAAAELDQRSTRPAVYEALERKRRAGCAVDAVVRDYSSGGGNKGVNELTALDVNAYGLRAGGCRYKVGGYSCNRATVHSKYLLTEWKDAAGKQVRHVYTGSHNWTAGALKKNDETLLRIDDPGVYQAFVDNFDKVRTAAVDIDAAKYGSSPEHYSRVNVAAAGDQHYSAMASSGSGTTAYTAVVYESGDRHDAADTELGTDVYIRMYRDGVPLWDEKKLSTSGTNATWSNQKPDVGIDDDGNAVVVWAADPDGNKYADIAVRKVTPDGTVTSLPRPHASGDGDQLRPTVAVSGTGAYAVAWEDTADGSTLNQVLASSWDGAGTLRYQDVKVSTITAGAAGSNRRPDAAMDASGNTAIVWEEDADGNGGINIGLAKLNTTGGFAVTRRVANTLTDGQQSKPAVAQTPDGRMVLAWGDEYTNGAGTVVRPERIQHRFFSATGVPAGVETRTVSESGTASAPVDPNRPVGAQSEPDVAAAADGSFVVAWREAFVDGFGDVWAAGFNADGTTAGRLPVTRMNVVTGGHQSGAAVALAPTGRLSLTYSDDYDQNGFNEMRLRDGFLNK